MDQLFLDVPEVPEVQAGDFVTLIGRNGGQEITAQDVFDHCGTTTNELCPLGRPADGAGAPLGAFWIQSVLPKLRLRRGAAALMKGTIRQDSQSASFGRRLGSFRQW